MRVCVACACMFVCACMHACMCVRVCVCACMHACACVCVCACMCTRGCMCVLCVGVGHVVCVCLCINHMGVYVCICGVIWCMWVYCGVHVTFVLVGVYKYVMCVHGVFLTPTKLMKLHATFSSLEEFCVSPLPPREPLKP